MTLTVVAAVKNPNSVIFGSDMRSTCAISGNICTENSRKIYNLGDLVGVSCSGYKLPREKLDWTNDHTLKRVEDIATHLQRELASYVYLAHLNVQVAKLKSQDEVAEIYSQEVVFPEGPDASPYLEIKYQKQDGEKVTKEIVPEEGELASLIVGGFDDRTPKHRIPKRLGISIPGKIQPIPSFSTPPGYGIIALGSGYRTYCRLVFGLDVKDFNCEKFPCLKDEVLLTHLLDATRFKFDWDNITQEDIVTFIEHLINLSYLMEKMEANAKIEEIGINNRIEIATVDQKEGFRWVKAENEKTQ